MEEKLLKSKLICNKASNNGIFGSVELFNFINSPDFEEIFKTANLLTNNGGKPDIILSRLIEEKGFNALPVLVDKHHYSLLLSSKLTRIYRGVVYKDAIKDFAYNENMFIGKGIYCNGVYFVYGDNAKSEAEQYVYLRMPNSIFHKARRYGAVIEALISNDANIIDINSLHKLSMKMVQKVQKLKGLSNEAKGKLITILTNDPAKCAVLKGYDAIDISGQNYLVVLNRSKLIMQKPKGKEK